MVRIGASVATLSELSSATLEISGDGAHVGLISGTVFLSSSKKNPLKAHAEDAMLWPHTNQTTQAHIQIYARKVLQISTRAIARILRTTANTACFPRADLPYLS